MLNYASLLKEIVVSSILGQSDAQVFACPKCGEMINTKMAQCAYCSAPVDPQWAMWASNAQATITRAFNHANFIMLAARGMVVLLVATFFPCGGAFALIALWSDIIVFPVFVLIWFSKYQWGLQGIDKNHDDLKQSRKRIMKASIIYGVTIIAWPIVTIVLGLIMRFFGIGS
jgi:hypothetical protein